MLVTLRGKGLGVITNISLSRIDGTTNNQQHSRTVDFANVCVHQPWKILLLKKGRPGNFKQVPFFTYNIYK